MRISLYVIRSFCRKMCHFDPLCGIKIVKIFTNKTIQITKPINKKLTLNLDVPYVNRHERNV